MNTDESKVYKILIVDDDRIIRAMLRTIFQEAQYSVTEADSGEMAIAIMPEVMPDLILLDIMMSGMDGFDALRLMRAHDKLKFIKVILLSSKSDVQERLKGYELGADDYMIKPFFGSELRAKVDVFMRMNHIEKKNISLNELVKHEVEKYKRQEQYILTQAKLISMGDMVRAIAHYWRQPLNALGVTIQDIQDAYTHDELSEEYLMDSIEKSMKHIHFMSDIIDGFQDILKSDKSEKVSCVNTIFSEVLSLEKEKRASEKLPICINNLHYQTFLDESNVKYYFKGHSWVLKQALVSIIDNSFDAFIEKTADSLTETKDMVNIKIWGANGTIFISESDTGASISESDVERVFEPYYSTKGEGEGVGLSLYFTRMLIEKHLNGKFYIAPTDGKLSFVIELNRV